MPINPELSDYVKDVHARVYAMNVLVVFCFQLGSINPALKGCGIDVQDTVDKIGSWCDALEKIPPCPICGKQPPPWRQQRPFSEVEEMLCGCCFAEKGA